jgi:hypothetical protein
MVLLGHNHDGAWGTTVLALQLNHNDFNDTAACLGPQVASVLDALAALPELSDTAWYAGAFDMIWPTEVRQALRKYEACESVAIDEIRSFVPLVRKVGQFLDGVFFSVPVGQPPLVAVKLLTADGPIQQLVTNAFVQVCAFDTSWIEIGSEDKAMIRQMQLRLGGKIVDSDDV